MKKKKKIRKIKLDDDFSPYDLNKTGGHIHQRDNTYSPYDLNVTGFHSKKKRKK